MTTASSHPPVKRKPPWLKVRLPQGGGYGKTLRTARERKLHTVCEGAMCPNLAECWARKTATFMILGDVCTRNCRFCAVPTGRPASLDPEEPERTADAVKELGLRHAVVTSVTRDDLPDGGAARFAETVRAIRRRSPETRVELLVPDFRGDAAAMETVWESAPDVLGHNVECVPSLQTAVRPSADYGRSLFVLEETKRRAPGLLTKTGIQLGHGETREELLGVMDDLVRIHVDIFTMGQYLQPTRDHLPVKRYVPPGEFETLRREALKKGIPHVTAGPLVRSSYHAEDPFLER